MPETQDHYKLRCLESDKDRASGRVCDAWEELLIALFYLEKASNKYREFREHLGGVDNE